MVNPDFEPTDREERVLDVLREEQRANPYLIREETGLGKGDVNTALTRLTSAGWVRKVTRGLYDFVDDPREQAADTAPQTAPEPDRPDRDRDHADRGGEPATGDLERELRAHLEGRPPRTEHGADAIVAAALLLAERGTMKTAELKSELFEEFGKHYGGEKALWESISRYLEDVPGVEKAGYGKWRFATDDGDVYDPTAEF